MFSLMMRLHSSAAVLAISLVIAAFDVEACQCRWLPDGREGAKQLLEDADAVFRGRVTSRDARGAALAFEVSRAWKGPTSQLIEVIAPGDDGDMCGLRAEVGGEYYVFARWEKPEDGSSARLLTSVCTGTNPVDYMQSRFPERYAYFEGRSDLVQQQALRTGGCASCAATGEGLGVLPLLALLRLVRRRASVRAQD